MNCPHCQSTKDPEFSRVVPMGYFCPDCGEDVNEDPMEALHTAVRQAEPDYQNLLAILADPHKVMLNMLHGTIAWTPETLRRVLGPDPVRDALENILKACLYMESLTAIWLGTPSQADGLKMMREAIAEAKKALTDTEPA